MTKKAPKSKSTATKKTMETPSVFSLKILSDGGYFGDTDYDSTSCTGNCSDYCRCSQIVNARIRSVCAASIVEEVVPKKHRNSILGYCVERVLRLCGVCDKENWSIKIVGGYYGQECNGISLDDITKNIAIKHINNLMSQSDSQRVEYVLQLEYGYTLPILSGKTWKLLSVDRNNIIVGQEQYYDRKLMPLIVTKYVDHQFPIAVCVLENGGRYRLIDGYHRFAASKNIPKITIVLAE